MLWIICFIGISVLLVIFLTVIFGKEKLIPDNFGVFIVFLAITAISLIGILCIDNVTYKEVEQTGNYNLLAFPEDDESKFHYVYISPNTNEIYAYYSINGEKPDKRELPENTIITEKENCIPHMEEYTIYTKSKMNRVLRGILTFDIFDLEKKTYEVYVPEGTILKSYSVDVK